MSRRPVFYIPALLILILFPIMLMVLMVTQLAYAAIDDDPFAPYAAVMPGQPSTALSQYPCQLQPGPEQAFEQQICHLLPTEGRFSEVTVLFDRTDRILQVLLKADGILVGDLVQRWGMPLAVNNNNRLFIQLHWRGAEAYVVASHRRQNERLSYWLRVYSITLTDAELSLPELSPTVSAPAPE